MKNTLKAVGGVLLILLVGSMIRQLRKARGRELSSEMKFASPNPIRNLSIAMNEKLPKKVDAITTLLRTYANLVEFNYIYSVDLDQAKFDEAFPVIKAQIAKRVCREKFTSMLLIQKKMMVKYLYYTPDRQKLGEFGVIPENCGVIPRVQLSGPKIPNYLELPTLEEIQAENHET